MAAVFRAALVLAALRAAQALVVDGPKDPVVDQDLLEDHVGYHAGDHLGEPYRTQDYSLVGDHVVDDEPHRDSKPGTPMAPNGTAEAMQGAPTWRSNLAVRIMKAATARDALQHCETFLSMGDFTWCRKAMAGEKDPDFKTKFGGVHLYIINKSSHFKSPAPAPETLAALSFGVEEGDLWSELMSNLFHVKPELYDCYYEGKKGPMVNNLHLSNSEDKPCQGRGCYTMPYTTGKICIDDTSTVNGGFKDTEGRKHAPLSTFLKGRAPLSTFLKMDIEGSEWAALERLLEDDEQLAKIRSIDMEVHFNRAPHAQQTNTSVGVTMIGSEGRTEAALTRNVEILEKLAVKFAVTGSTLEPKLRDAVKNHQKPRKFLGNVITQDGFDLDQFCISFVNRKLL